MNAKHWKERLENQEAAQRGEAPPPRPETLKALKELLNVLADVKEYVDAAIRGDLSAMDEITSEYAHPHNVVTRACQGVLDGVQTDDDDEATAAEEAEEKWIKACEAQMREEAAYRAERP